MGTEGAEAEPEVEVEAEAEPAPTSNGFLTTQSPITGRPNSTLRAASSPVSVCTIRSQAEISNCSFCKNSTSTSAAPTFAPTYVPTTAPFEPASAPTPAPAPAPVYAPPSPEPEPPIFIATAASPTPAPRDEVELLRLRPFKLLVELLLLVEFLGELLVEFGCAMSSAAVPGWAAARCRGVSLRLSCVLRETAHMSATRPSAPARGDDYLEVGAGVVGVVEGDMGGAGGTIGGGGVGEVRAAEVGVVWCAWGEWCDWCG
eukprot:CAMPEP_0173272184 /NCGR_PEP_ID=MMETSP1143-20121109/1222_1 /TAXON_ID=483371 /ORGANISM="non described non described, Strain CCMP2298" /LENGTH=258 /DNA_ID=CAMNT_0014208813 /DNA_START=243 /DNA_END=1021 /DNA_ORIENTATION=+